MQTSLILLVPENEELPSNEPPTPTRLLLRPPPLLPQRPPSPHPWCPAPTSYRPRRRQSPERLPRPDPGALPPPQDRARRRNISRRDSPAPPLSRRRDVPRTAGAAALLPASLDEELSVTPGGSTTPFTTCRAIPRYALRGWCLLLFFDACVRVRVCVCVRACVRCDLCMCSR